MRSVGLYQLGDSCLQCPLNSIVSSSGAAECTLCAPGYAASADQQSCEPCPFGTYRSANLSQCTPVPARAAAKQGSAVYEMCGNGTVPSAIRSDCVECRAGSYQLEDQCLPCPPNTITSDPGKDQCETCPEGYEAAADRQTCTPCLAGTYRHAPLVSCQRVPVGAAAVAASRNYTVCNSIAPNMTMTSCIDCDPGMIADETRQHCRACEPGFFQPDRTSGCERCPAALFSQSMQFGQCKECPAGQVPNEKQDGCMWCRPGYGKPANASICLICENDHASPDGTGCKKCELGFVSQPDRLACLPCRAGTAESSRSGECVPSGAAECTLCAPGYAASADQQSCEPCPFGTYRSANLSQCTPVPARAAAKQGSAVYEMCGNGTVPSAIRSDCVECRAGSYQLEDQCLPCPPNTITSDPGKDQCETCPEGYEAAADRQTCTPCLAGTYRHAPLVSCQRVPVGAAAVAASRNYTVCARGTVPSDDLATCLPCPRGTYERDWRPASASSCHVCPAAYFANAPGRAQCDFCPPGTESADNRVACTPCPLGYAEVNGTRTCRFCDEGTVAEDQGAVECRSCAPGEISNGDRTRCTPCQAGTFKPRNMNVYSSECIACTPGTFMPEGSQACLRCPENFIAPDPGTAFACTPCDAGYTASANRRVCEPCALGFYRPLDSNSTGNATMSYCEPCPSGTFAAAAGSAACTLCSSTQLCPIATSEPIDISDFKKLISETISEALAAAKEGLQPATGRVRRGLLLARRLLGAGDFLKRISSDETAMSFVSENVTYDTNTATIVRPEIRTEEVAKQRLYLVFALLVSCVGVLLLLAGVCLYSYLKVPLASPSERKLERAEHRQRRAERIMKLDRLYTNLIATKRQEVKGDAKNETAKTQQEEAAEDEEENQKTLYGVIFTMIGIGLAAIAAGYVLLQFSIANFSIIQTLQPGASPSAADIAGALNVTASFAGFAGPCQIVQRAGESALNVSRFDGRAGVDVFVSGIGPVDGWPAPVAETSFSAGRRTCLVSWRCAKCRLLAASNVTVDFRLVSRLALAVAVNYAIQVPSNLSIEGVIVPSSQAEFSVFRGTVPVTVPVSLFPLHFEDERDGTPRYDAALRPADNRATEKGEGSFGLCSFTKPLSDPECAGESVTFRVLFNIDNIYVRVYRKVKASIADMLADLSSLTQTAIAIGGQIAVTALTARYFMKGRRGQPTEDARGELADRDSSSTAGSSVAADPKLQLRNPAVGKQHAASASDLKPDVPRSSTPSGSVRAPARMTRRRSNSFGDIEGLGAVHIYEIDDDPADRASRAAHGPRSKSPGLPPRPTATAGSHGHTSRSTGPSSSSAQPLIPGPSSRYAYSVASATATLPIPNLPASAVRVISLLGSSASAAGSSNSSVAGSSEAKRPAAPAGSVGAASLPLAGPSPDSSTSRAISASAAGPSSDVGSLGPRVEQPAVESTGRDDAVPSPP
eukprot:tig00000475_g1236.t1